MGLQFSIPNTVNFNKPLQKIDVRDTRFNRVKKIDTAI